MLGEARIRIRLDQRTRISWDKVSGSGSGWLHNIRIKAPVRLKIYFGLRIQTCWIENWIQSSW